MAKQLRLLAVNAYHPEGRAELATTGCTDPGELYRRMLDGCAPGSHIDVIRPADADTVLTSGADLASYDGVAWSGSSLTIHQPNDAVNRQIELSRAAFDAGVPQFGSCWAAQIAAVVAGGTCAANPKGREFGVARKIALTPEGRAHPMYTGKISVFDGFTSHGDEVTHLPSGAVLLSGNQFTWVQALAVSYKAGSFWAVQYHPEYDLREISRLADCRRGWLINQGRFADDDDAQSFIDKLEALHQDPGRGDIAWQLGVDEDVMDFSIRTREVRNWIDHEVIPTAARR